MFFFGLQGKIEKCGGEKVCVNQCSALMSFIIFKNK